MATKVEFESIIIRNYSGTKIPVWLAALPNKSFTNAEGHFVGGGSIKTVDRDWIVKVAVAADGNGVYHSATFTGDNALSATVWDSVDKKVVWNFYLLDANLNILKTLYKGIKISDALTSTSIEDAEEFSRTPNRTYNRAYVGWTQLYAYLAGLQLAGDWSTITKGKGYIDTVGADTAVATTNPVFLAIQKSKYVTTLAQLNAAITSFASDNGTIIYTDEINITADKTIPDNISLIQSGDGAFNISPGVTLTIENGLGFQSPPDRQVFFGDGSVYFSGSIPETFYPEWLGALGDGTTDDLAAFNAINTIRPINTALKVWLAPGKNYKLSAAWEIDNVTEVHSSSHAFGGRLTFPANSIGIIPHHKATKTGTDDGRTAWYSVFKNFRIVGNNNTSTVTPTHTVNVTGTTVTKTSGASFVDADGYIEGNTITIGTYTYPIASITSPSVLEIKPRALQVAATNGSADVTVGTYEVWDVSGLWDGQDIIIGGNTYEIDEVTLALGVYHITLTTNFTGTTGAYTAELQGLAATNGLAARVNLFHGFDLRAPVEISGCYVVGFPGNAISAGGSSETGLPGTTPNENNSLIERNIGTGCAGSGFFSRGINANHISVINNDFTNNKGYGIWEYSFLGNRFFGNHTSFNYSGCTRATTNGVNVSTFTGEYSESAQPAAYYGEGCLVLGGTHGAGFAADSKHVYLRGEVGKLVADSLIVRQGVDGTNTKSWMAGFGASNLGNSLFGFGAGEEAANVFSSYAEARYPAFQLFYDLYATGTYSLNFKRDTLGSPGDVLLVLEGSEAASGGGRIFVNKMEQFNAQTGTTYTLALTDALKYITLSNAAAITLTVPANASAAFPVGQRIPIAQLGAGQVTVVGAGGVTVNGTPGLKLRAQYSEGFLTKTATNTWLLTGDLAA